MAYRSNGNFLCDQSGDQGDSAVRASIMTLFSDEPEQMGCYVRSGYVLRSPVQYPWDNKKNVTRDQMIPVTAALLEIGDIENAREIFWKTAGRCFFSQSTERDIPGSTKYPWAHTFTDDHGNKQTKLFDFADPLLPDHVWHLIRCARLWPLYWFALIGVPFFCLSLFIHSRSSHREHNQIISQAKVNGAWAVRLFKKLVPKWKEDLMEYWGSRNEIEYATIIIRWMENI